jgi:hypothetical protein
MISEASVSVAASSRKAARPPGGRRGLAGFARHAQQIQRQHHGDVDGGIGEAGPAPAGMVHQPGAERPADRAGKAADQRDMGDGGAGAFAEQPAQRGEGRIVQAGAHADAHDRPAQQVKRQIGRGTQHHQPGGQQQRAGGQYHAAAARLDQPSDARRHQARDQEAERQAADHPGERPSGIRDNRPRQHGDQVVGRSPGQHLRQSDRTDDGQARAVSGQTNWPRRKPRAGSGVHLRGRSARRIGATL